MSAPVSRRSPLIFLGFFSLLPLAGVAAPLATAPLLGLAGVLSLRPRYLWQTIKTLPLAVWFLLAFSAWAAASSSWSQYDNHGQALRLWATLAPGLIFVAAAQRDGASRRWTRAAGLAAVCMLMALLGAEALLNLPINRAFQHNAATWEIERNPGRGVSILLAMVWAAAAGLAAEGGLTRKRLSLVLLALAGVLAPQFEDNGNLVAFAFGLAAYIAGYVAPRIATLLASWGLAAWLIVAPLVTPILFANPRLADALPYSWAARIGIWRYVCARIAAHPIIGSGLDASRTVTDTINLRGAKIIAVQLHPHSASLHIWFETGGVGASLGALTLIIGGWSIARSVGNNRRQAAAVCATLAALGVIANVDYGAWQEWWDATILIGAAMLFALGAKPAPQ